MYQQKFYITVILSTSGHISPLTSTIFATKTSHYYICDRGLVTAAIIHNFVIKKSQNFPSRTNPNYCKQCSKDKE